MIYLIIGIALLMALAFFIMWKKKLVVSEYTVKAPVDMDLLILSDLHSMDFGENQRELLDLVDSIPFDAILMPGDIFDDKIDDKKGYEFIEGIKEYKCYYILGNNEIISGKAELHMKELASMGITVLDDGKAIYKADDKQVEIWGFRDRHPWRMKDYAAHVARTLDSDTDSHDYRIVLSHKPLTRNEFEDINADLIIAGHAHGGQWRLPPINNGVFAPNQGIFPKYAGGVYEANGRCEVVSRGLARGLKLVPRLNNPPEIVLLHLRK